MRLNIEQREGDEFGRMLYKARIARAGVDGKPLPMRKAAYILDVTEVTYGSWEKGNAKPTLRPGEGLLQRLAHFTQRSEIELLEALDILSPGAGLGGRDSNPQPIDYQGAFRNARLYAFPPRLRLVAE